MVDNVFFDESREQSQVKARIAAKYFWAWAKVVIPTAKQHENRIAYIDLFAGPGRYEDGTLSTPLMILTKAIEDRDMREMLVAVFNDKDAENVGKLHAAIHALPGIERLKYEPQINNTEVGNKIVRKFQKMKFIPTFFFIDPWGYKGLSLGLINSVLKHWGCDCVFFFNYNRVNMGLNNQAVRRHMNVLFGKKRATRLRRRLTGLDSNDRERLILDQLSESLKEMGANLVLPFRFRSEIGNRTTHHLIFATKHFKGYEIMREIMGHESSEENQGVPSFEYSPAAEKWPKLLHVSSPLEELAEMLVIDFAGETLTMRDLYERHSAGRLYLSRNYKRALASLEGTGKIRANPSAEERPTRKGEITFADTVVVRFPRGKLR
jgi:three-Cys-motif partner protein